MSTQRNPTRSPASEARPSVARRMVAAYDAYAEAEAAVDSLADRGFPVEHAQIVGRGLKMVEQVTGRMRPLDAFLRGALSGALAGALIGWLFGLFNWTDPVVATGWLMLDGLWIGALIGGVTSLITYLVLLRGRRDFASVSTLSADRYELLVDEPVADEAAKLLASGDAPTTGTTGTTGTT